MTAHDLDKIIELTVALERANTRAARLYAQHCQLMLVVTRLAGGSFRLTQEDFQDTIGWALETGKDDLSGDLLFEAVPPKGLTPEAAPCSSG